MTALTSWWYQILARAEQEKSESALKTVMAHLLGLAHSGKDRQVFALLKGQVRTKQRKQTGKNGRVTLFFQR